MKGVKDMCQEIKVVKTTNPKTKPTDQSKLGFGLHFTDHMFTMDYSPEKGWHDAKVTPYAPLELDPAAMVLHYGQAIFEGLKAYRTEDGRILLFRPQKNIERLNLSNERLGIPTMDENVVLEALKTIVNIESDWIPTAPGTSLYLRPFVIATDAHLGVRPSNTYKFIIILSPVGAYYPEGLKPIKIYVEDKYVRAVKGGMGSAKTAGNYAASIKAQIEAKEKGYIQVLWLDGVERKYIEEVGAMNVFFKINGEVLTPSLEGSILAGVTRDSVINLLKSFGLKVSERRISIEEIYEAHEKGLLEEAFGTGTAAVISPMGELNWKGNKIIINNEEVGPISEKLYKTMTDIQNGRIEDNFNWTVEV